MDDTDLIPLYRRISRDLSGRVANGEFIHDVPMPTEQELCRHYGVSRITVRKALDELVAQGLVIRKRGLGTFVADGVTGRWSVTLRGVLEDVLLPYNFTVTEEGELTPPAHILSFGGHAESVPHKAIKGINYAESGEPLVKVEYYFPPPVGTLLTVETLRAAKGAINAVQQVTGRVVHHADQVVEAIVMDDALAEMFALPKRTPALQITRAFYDGSGEILQLYRGAYHPVHYRYSATLYPRSVP